MLVLASNSPRRRDLLSLGGWDFQVLSVAIDERPRPEETSREYVQRIAQEKAISAVSRSPSGSLVVAADTTVVKGNDILGKPATVDEALAMLTHLRGRRHQVYTAVSVLEVSTLRQITDLCITEVYMRPYTQEEMCTYVASGNPYDKAGGYAIQHAGFNPVERLSGCYANVIGLPLCHLTRILSKFNLQPIKEITRSCQEAFKHKCSAWKIILQESS